MINKDFFPTPETLIQKMISGVKFEGLSVLEPSAGKGDLAEAILRRANTQSTRRFSLDVIEIEPELQAVLKSKKFRLVHDDFLTFNSRKQYDLIIANFPFSDGDSHLQKALRMLDRFGGKLIAIVNAETIRNPFSNTRKWCLQKLNDFSADIEFLQGEFTGAERKSNVEVALVRVEIETEAMSESVIFKDLKESDFFAVKDDEPVAIAPVNYIQEMLASFQVESELGLRFIGEYCALKPYIKDRIETDKNRYASPLIELKIYGDTIYNPTKPTMFNKYLQGLRAKYWSNLIESQSFNGKYTSNVLKDLYNKRESLKDYDFTLFNIQKLEAELSEQITKGVADSILKMFDEFSHQYHWCDTSNNLHYYNGWKTNKAHKINHKIILPVNGISAYSYGTNHREIDKHYIHEKLEDIVKVFNVLASERNCNAFQLVGNQIEYANKRKDYELDLRYLEVKFYKKGTCHIKFKDKDLLDKLNIYGSQRKGWLPPCYGKVSYNEMDAESKAVVDEFQGKDEYNKVFARKDFYLIEPKNLLLTA